MHFYFSRTIFVLIPTFLFCFAAAAEVIDNEPSMRPQVTKRMVKKAEKEANPPPPKVPAFLQHCQNSGKRFRDAGGKIKTSFQPDWGVCDQDSISGSSLLAIDWSKCSITPADRVEVVSSTGLDEGEQLGSLAMYQVNTLLSLCQSFTLISTFLTCVYALCRPMLISSLFSIKPRLIRRKKGTLLRQSPKLIEN